MKNQDFARLLETFVTRTETKQTDYDNLSREEKIQFCLSGLQIENLNAIMIKTTKVVEIAKLSKDHRFELIEQASKAGDMAKVTALALAKGEIEIEISKPFQQATLTAQLDWAQSEYIKKVGSIPGQVTLPNLGGENFKRFIDFCYEYFHAQN